jgi:hypothetical protein
MLYGLVMAATPSSQRFKALFAMTYILLLYRQLSASRRVGHLPSLTKLIGLPMSLLSCAPGVPKESLIPNYPTSYSIPTYKIKSITANWIYAHVVTLSPKLFSICSLVRPPDVVEFRKKQQNVLWSQLDLINTPDDIVQAIKCGLEPNTSPQPPPPSCYTVFEDQM